LLDAHHAFAEEKAPAAQVSVAIETCELPLVRNGVTYRLAEHRYPKRDAANLSRVTVLGRHVASQTVGVPVPPGYLYQQITDGVFVRDGAVAVVCSTWAENPFEAVVFVLPRQYKLDLDTANPW
jgi:hypothetical protein